MNQKILDHIEDLDVRRAFGVRPRRISPERVRALERALDHDRIFYNTETCTLMNFRPPGYHEIRRPVRLDIVDDGLYVFNLYQEMYVYEVYGDHGGIVVDPIATSSWATESRVKILRS